MKVYYAHHMWKYGTKIEEYEIGLIRKVFSEAEYDILNPATDIDQTGTEEAIMERCLKAIDECDEIVFSDISGVVGKGVKTEVEYARASGKWIYRILNNNLDCTDNVRFDVIEGGTNRVYAVVRESVNHT